MMFDTVAWLMDDALDWPGMAERSADNKTDAGAGWFGLWGFQGYILTCATA